ncbi:glycoside hydrolase family 16 protein [Nocardioides sp. Y6]|uniref:Glycoside hydrolase family 16 protein n=1 Tax=Nocardioides malaquae TaxID=2773426 RepID=A0ABR9RVH1_9ACTN|nr:glycoside hydrolase family 16 protein [Nocardioides malaquae]MBE7325559.1 glycoside hydrolase family 16 protein [Nocardioides malaquae]
MTSRRIAALAATMLLSACALNQGASSAETRGQAGSSASASPTITTEAPTARKQKGARKAKKVTVRVLPQIAQPGGRTAKSAKAKSAVLVQVKPKRATAVTLQAKAGKKWKKVGSATTDRRGQHVFHAAAKRGGKAATYRVAVGKKTSKAESTERWLTSKFTDEFNGKKLSDSWEHRKQYRDPLSSRACSRGAKNAVKVKGGVVRLSVLKDKSAKKKKCRAVSDGKKQKFNYRLNGHIGTQSSVSFKYGFAAARVKFPRAQGQHGSFWLQPVAPDPHTANPKQAGAEIDIIESFGANAGPKGSMGLSSFTYHRIGKIRNGTYNSVKTGGYLKNVPSVLGKKDDVFKRYHVFSVEWTPKSYVFRIDGKETWRSKKGVSGTEQYAILSLLSSDWELGRARSEKKINEQMQVDWMRIWETGGS